MKNISFALLASVLSLTAACTEDAPDAERARKEESSLTETEGCACQPIDFGSGGPGVGMANPASAYCSGLGYELSESSCRLPNGTTCEPWAFFRGECAPEYSFCARQGGRLTTVTEADGEVTTTRAVCTLPSGASCDESAFSRTCRCE